MTVMEWVFLGLAAAAGYGAVSWFIDRQSVRKPHSSDGDAALPPADAQPPGESPRGPSAWDEMKGGPK
jgi:hypothetical protein